MAKKNNKKRILSAEVKTETVTEVQSETVTETATEVQSETETKKSAVETRATKIKSILSKINYREYFEKAKACIKKTAIFLFEKYRRWLYSEVYEKVESHVKDTVSRWAAALICLLIFCTFGLYYLGYFELGFIERPAAWADNRSKFQAVLFKKDEEPEADAPETENTEKKENTVSSSFVSTVDMTYTFVRDRNEGKITSTTVFKTSTDLEAEGYSLTDSVYDEATCEVALMEYSFGMPTRFSVGKMLKRDWVITEYEDGRESEVEDTEVETERPAVYLYMGYIIYDDAGGGVYLCDSTGNVLMKYNENYIPAMARTKEGKPLFYTTYTYSAEVPVAETENEIGELEPTEYKTVKLKGKKYYTVSDNGRAFVETDYIEERDGRGLNFDFTADYVLSDCDIQRIGIITPKYTTYLTKDTSKKYALVNYMNWNYYREKDKDILNFEEMFAYRDAYNALSIEEKKLFIDAKVTPDDLYNTDELLPYTYAYDYRGDYAVVVTKDTGEDPKYETEEVRVLNNIGQPMFASKKKYYNSHIKDYVSDRYLLPLSKGEDSVGHLYFDHGLLRLRKVCYDNFQLEEFGLLRINTDSDILVYPNGREFPIPEGYNLKGYSDGIMVLERDGLYGYMDYTGRWIADPEYEYAEAFHGGVGVLTFKDGKVCAVNTDGGYVLPPRFDYIQNRSDGLIAAYSKDRGWEVYGIFSK